jgi:histidinol-phosphate phosphatase family protein
MITVFLDRDGVINEDRDDYVKDVAELRIYPYAPPAIRLLSEAGMQVFVISNQQGVAKGLIREEDLAAIQAEITGRVEEAGGRISGFYYCKHLAADNCSCRKPQPGMLLRAAEENGVDLRESFMVGDTERDVMAGKSAGCSTVLLLSGKLTRQDAEKSPSKPDHIANNLAEAAEYIVSLQMNAQKH